MCPEHERSVCIAFEERKSMYKIRLCSHGAISTQISAADRNHIDFLYVYSGDCAEESARKTSGFFLGGSTQCPPIDFNRNQFA